MNEIDKTLLQECCEVLGWKGGTIHQVKLVLLNAKILVEKHHEAFVNCEYDEFKTSIAVLTKSIKG
jgi:hypothetical protein